ncbi:MAG TPA: tetratricopeptide repeat protein, partial [Verrucomicrobiae bacterium]|nr:tetratricopeptide repeat protein [Verrucomicrobiae bacterium]
IGPTPGPLDNVLAGAPIGPRLLTALAVVARYARRLAWPLGLSADYSYRQVELATGLGDPVALAGLGVVAGAVALAAWGWRHERHVCLAIALAALPYSIVSNVFVTIGTVMAERLLYLPSAGFCLVVASAADALGRPSRAWRASGAIVVALLAFYVPATVLRNSVWRERRGFFEALVASAPRSARSHRELGLVYSDLGLHERAIAELERALAILPGDMVNLYDLGNVLLRAGRSAEAIEAYRKALARQPDFVPAMTNLGNAYSAAGDERSAEAWFRAALARAPRAFDPRLNLANALVRQGRLAEAEPEYRQAIALAPDDPLVRANYAMVLSGLGRREEAAAQLRLAATLPPSGPAAAVAVVTLLRAAGMPQAARAAQTEAERRFPDDPGVRRTRAELERGAGG